MTARHRTAMRRRGLSRPIRLALLHELLTPERSFFDYGCGRGDDVAALVAEGYRARGWDPAHRPDARRLQSDVVNVGYVVNVIEDPDERVRVVRQAWKLTRRVLVLAARLEHERDEAHLAPRGDGWVTAHGTFQRFFEHEELGEWLGDIVGARPVAAGLGVYYVFKQAADRESYLASRFRRRVSLPTMGASDRRFQAHRRLLEPLMVFVATRGRLPASHELANAEAVETAFGSLRRAYQVVLRVTDRNGWQRVTQARSVDLLVHLSLARFHGRARFGELPDELQRDVRAFFSSYRAACEKADRLLFATGNRDAVTLSCRAALVGKPMPTALYVHCQALGDLPALLRVYEGCGRALVGTIEQASVVKLHRAEPRVSYLTYDRFDEDPHPVLERSTVCDLVTLRTRTERYDGRDNPPVLHRKELLVGNDYPGRAKFAALTAREEKLGLYDEPERIGTREGWRAVCHERGIRFRGHHLIRNHS